jgi:uncharacterized membrane protein
MNTDALVEVLLRWGHVISGITWIGHLYFFNFVNVPFQGKLDAETKKKVNPELLPRALWWFRWGAMSTLVFGLLLFWWLYLYQTGNMTQPKGGLTGRALYIMIGMLLAIIMWFNVWFVIWPAQKQIIGGLKSGTPAPAHLPKRALLFSRTNTYLSGPMLFFMFLSPHAQDDFRIEVFLIAAVVGAGTVFLAIRSSGKVGTTI